MSYNSVTNKNIKSSDITTSIGAHNTASSNPIQGSIKGVKNAAGSFELELFDSPTTAQKYLTDLQAKVDRMITKLVADDVDFPEMEFFRKDLGKFVGKTVNPDDVALILFEKKVLTQEHLRKIRFQTFDGEKNDIIYHIVIRKGEIAHLMNALYKTGNMKMLKLIDEIASDNVFRPKSSIPKYASEDAPHLPKRQRLNVIDTGIESQNQSNQKHIVSTNNPDQIIPPVQMEGQLFYPNSDLGIVMAKPCQPNSSLTRFAFIGRKSKICEIKLALASCKDKPSCWERMIVIHGQSGVGKTSIAKEIVNSSKDMYEYIFWFDAGSQSSLLSSFYNLANLISVPFASTEDFTAVYNYLGQNYKSGLFIFDNSRQLETTNGIKNFLPINAPYVHPQVLVTSQSCRVFSGGVNKNIKRIHLDCLSTTDAFNFFLNYLGINQNQAIPYKLDNLIVKMIKRVGGHPLSLSMIGGLIADRSKILTFSKLERHLIELLELLEHDDLVSNNKITIKYTVTVIGKYILDKLSSEFRDELALDVLGIVALLSLEEKVEAKFIQDIYYNYVNYSKLDCQFCWSDLKQDFRSALNLLNSYSMTMIESLQNDSVRIHIPKLVQDCICEELFASRHGSTAIEKLLQHYVFAEEDDINANVLARMFTLQITKSRISCANLTLPLHCVMLFLEARGKKSNSSFDSRIEYLASLDLNRDYFTMLEMSKYFHNIITDPAFLINVGEVEQFLTTITLNKHNEFWILRCCIQFVYFLSQSKYLGNADNITTWLLESWTECKAMNRPFCNILEVGWQTNGFDDKNHSFTCDVFKYSRASAKPLLWKSLRNFFFENKSKFYNAAGSVTFLQALEFKNNEDRIDFFFDAHDYFDLFKNVVEFSKIGSSLCSPAFFTEMTTGVTSMLEHCAKFPHSIKTALLPKRATEIVNIFYLFWKTNTSSCMWLLDETVNIWNSLIGKIAQSRICSKQLYFELRAEIEQAYAFCHEMQEGTKQKVTSVTPKIGEFKTTVDNAKNETPPLEDFAQPQQAYMLKNTINPDQIATELHTIKILDDQDAQQIRIKGPDCESAVYSGIPTSPTTSWGSMKNSPVYSGIHIKKSGFRDVDSVVSISGPNNKIENPAPSSTLPPHSPFGYTKTVKEKLPSMVKESEEQGSGQPMKDVVRDSLEQMAAKTKSKSPITPNGKAVLTQLNTYLLQFQHETQPLENFLRPKLLHLYETTLNPDDLAVELYALEVLTYFDLQRIKLVDQQFLKNELLYSIVFAKNAVKELIIALEKTGNERIITKLSSMTSSTIISDAPVQPSNSASPGKTPSWGSMKNSTIYKDIHINKSGMRDVDSVVTIIGPNNKIEKPAPSPTLPPLSPFDDTKAVKEKLASLVKESEEQGSDQPLKEILRDYFEQMAAKTKDGVVVAAELHTRRILTDFHLQKIMQCTEPKRSKLMYEYATNKTCVEDLVDTLKNTNNLGVIAVLMAV